MNEKSYLAQFGPRLIAQGYNIVPIPAGGKRPILKGWTKNTANSKQLGSWLANGYGGTDVGVGVQTTNIPAVDIDVEDTEITEKLVEWCDANLGSTLRRTGKRRRVLLPFRSKTPFKKKASTKYRDFLGLEHQVEILARGYQFVAYATHPTTGRPYEWDGENGLAETPVSDLPEITEQQAIDLITYFESIVPDDWEPVSRKRTSYTLTTANSAIENAKPKAYASLKPLKQDLSVIDPDLDYDPWIDIGMAIYFETDGSEEGFNLWDDWSAEGVRYEPEVMRTHWGTFEADLRNTDPITGASIKAMAKVARRTSSDETKKSPLDKFVERYVLVEHGNLVCDLKKPPHCAVSRLDEFRNATANVRHLVPAPTKAEPDKEKLQPVHHAWILDRDRKTAQGVKYDPSKSFFFQDEQNRLWWVNEFYMPEFKTAINSDTSVFHQHLEYLFPVERERQWFIDWIAFNVQYPGRRCKVTPLHISIAHGTGRAGSWNLWANCWGNGIAPKQRWARFAAKAMAAHSPTFWTRACFAPLKKCEKADAGSPCLTRPVTY